MALVNWNPVAAANFSESNALRLAAQQQLAGGIKGIGDTAVAFNDATGKANTDILLNSLVGQRSPEAAAAAIQAAKAQAGGMYSNYDQAAFRSAAEALPKSAADAQELDFQNADKPFLQAATLAYSKRDPEAVAHFASQIKSNAGRAELSKLIGDSHTMGVQDAGVLNAEGKLAEEVRNNKQQNEIDWFEARKKPRGDNVFGRQVLTAQQSLQALKNRYAKEDLTATTGTVADREALQATINGKDGAALDSWGNGTPKNMHKVLMETSPAYAGAGAKKQNSVLRALIQENTTQTGGGWWDRTINRDLTDDQITTRGSVILGEVTAETDTLRQQELTSEQARNLAKLRGELAIKGDPAANASDEVLYEVLYPGWNEQQRQAAASTPPPKPKEDPKAAEQYLKDKAELAAREAKRQAALAAGKGTTVTPAVPPTRSAFTPVKRTDSIASGIMPTTDTTTAEAQAKLKAEFSKKLQDKNARSLENARNIVTSVSDSASNLPANLKNLGKVIKSVIPST